MKFIQTVVWAGASVGSLREVSGYDFCGEVAGSVFHSQRCVSMPIWWLPGNKCHANVMAALPRHVYPVFYFHQTPIVRTEQKSATDMNRVLTLIFLLHCSWCWKHNHRHEGTQVQISDSTYLYSLMSSAYLNCLNWSANNVIWPYHSTSGLDKVFTSLSTVCKPQYLPSFCLTPQYGTLLFVCRKYLCSSQ